MSANGGPMDMAMGLEQVLVLTREIATIGAKMDGVDGTLKRLEKTIVTKTELEAVEQRVTKLEGAGHKNWQTATAVISCLVSVSMLIFAIVQHK